MNQASGTVMESAAVQIPELAAACRMAPATEGAADWRRADLGPEALCSPREHASMRQAFSDAAIVYGHRVEYDHVGEHPVGHAAYRRAAETIRFKRSLQLFQAFEVESRAVVDERAEWLRARGAEIESGPEEYDYRPGYYAVFFYDPDGIKLELLHVPK